MYPQQGTEEQFTKESAAEYGLCDAFIFTCSTSYGLGFTSGL